MVGAPAAASTQGWHRHTERCWGCALQVPGYTLLPGRGLFSFGRYNCSESLR